MFRILSVCFLVQLCCFCNAKIYRSNVGSPPVSEETVLPDEEWIMQKLDHFNPSNSCVWRQRYFKNADYFDNFDKPVAFLMIGGEGEITPKWTVAGQWIEYAKKFHAVCFQLEHRFYGKSHPTKDMGVKNLIYLNSEQALADLAYFISLMNDKYKLNSNVKWIVFGGSYAGSLAAWLRMKYPHLVHGAVSSSGPLLAKADFWEYYKVVVDSLRTSSDECVSEVRKGVKQIYALLNHRIGQMSVDKKFRLCDPIENATKLDRSNFFENIADMFAGIVQYNKDNRIGEANNITIDIVCRIMTDVTAGNAIDRLANINSIMLELNNKTCLDYNYNSMIEKLRDPDWNSTANDEGRQWIYQTCNEFGFYQTSGGEADIFTNEFPLSFFTQQCSDIFGIKYDELNLFDGILRTNMMYGALDYQTNRVIFVHGSIDPWHALGITKTIENQAPALYIQGTAHCADIYPPRDEDLPSLKAARVMIGELIESWINK